MVASRSGGGRRRGTWIAASCLAMSLGLYACATAELPEWQAAGEIPAAEPGALRDVVVERDGEVSLVTLSGLEDPVYSIYRQADPPALVLDIAAVDAAGLVEPVRVYDGLVEEVSVSSFASGSGETMTRVEVSLAQPAEYDVTPSWDGLVLLVRAGQAELADAPPAESEADPWETSEALLETTAAAGSIDFDAPLAVDAAPAATTLSGIDVQLTSDGLLVHLQADGVIGSSESFTLEDPARLVIDLPGLSNAVTEARIPVGVERVRRVRVGAHPGKVRVVVDGGPAAEGFANRRLVPAADGLAIALGRGEDLDQALAARVAEVAIEDTFAATEASLGADFDPFAESDAAASSSAAQDPGFASVPVASTTVVHGIHIDSEGARERIAVLSEGPIEFLTYEPDPETFVVSILGASIPAAAQGRVLPPPGGPVSVVSIFQQPDVERPEVRLVMKRAPGLDPEMVRHGALLFIDFPRSDVAAAPPPAFVAPESGLELAAAPAALVSADAAGAAMASGAEAAEAGFDPAAPALPQFGETGALSAPQVASAPAPAGAVAPPASLEPPAAVELLQEGGLIDGKEYQGRRISLDFKDVEIADVLRIIADVSDLNVVAGDEVKGSVTIRLVDVPWDQALDVILLTKGLGFVRVGNVLRIAPTDILQQEEELRLTERRNKEKLEDLVVKLHPVNYADVEEVSKLVKRLLTARGTVHVDKRTSTLIIKDIASVVDESIALVEAIDTQTPQVMIEAKIVEANLDFSRELGSVWSAGTQPLDDGFDSSSNPRRDLGSEDLKFHDNNSVVFANPITSLATGLLSLNAFILDEKFNVGVQIAAAEAEGNGKVISSPRVVTLDNREAQISQGVSIPFQTFENGDAKLEFIDAVLKLLVTPHITADESIIMKIEVTRNAPDDTVSTPTGSPAIAKNEAKTETLVKNGQTLVIGGIYTVTKSERESRVPYLHRIPLIGSAFKSREVTDKRKELLIFVTPRLVRPVASLN